MDPLAESDPRQLGPYKIVARLGSGGMGVVFLGSRGSARVAVKVMRSSFLDSPALRTRFEREIETLKKIKSSFVARYLDSDVEGDLVWHAVEFVNGPTLKEKIENDGPLDEGDWWALYSQMREALNDVHKLGLVHRDLKPANIILSETGLKLIDFGIAQDSEATSLTSTGMVAGSPAWLSPEQLEGTEVGPGSDLFSAGSILTYAAIGRSPWGKETTMTVPVAYKKILTRDFELEDLPSAYRAAVSQLFAERSQERGFQDHPELVLAPKNQATSEKTNRLPYESAEGFVGDETKNRPWLAFILVALPLFLLVAFLGYREQVPTGPQNLTPNLEISERDSPSVDAIPAESLESKAWLADATRDRVERTLTLKVTPAVPLSPDDISLFFDVVELDRLGDVTKVFSLGSCGNNPIELKKSPEGFWIATCEGTIGPAGWGAGVSHWIRLQTSETEEFLRLQFPTDNCNPWVDANCAAVPGNTDFFQ